MYTSGLKEISKKENVQKKENLSLIRNKEKIIVDFISRS